MKTKDILPQKVRLEACSICQLKCKECKIQKDPLLKKGYLKFDDFKKFINKNKYIKEIELSNNGEIFLNPDLIYIIQYAHEKNVLLTANNGVNFNTVSDKVIESLVKYKFKSISFSIDGASQDTYSKYRINGDFNTVINNIKKLISYKEKYNSDLPKLKWQFILMEHNENDVILAKQLAAELNIPIKFKLTWEKGYKPVNIEMLKNETGLLYLTRDEFSKNEKKEYKNSICMQLWNAPQINYDGLLFGCCSNRIDFGINVFKTNLKKAIQKRNYIFAKKMLQGIEISPRDEKNIPCTSCYIFKKMKETGNYISINNFK